MMQCRSQKARPENSSPLFRASITATREISAMSRARVYATVEEMPRAEKPKNPRFMDLTGKTFGKLTVLHYAGAHGGLSAWACRCSCAAQPLVVATGSDMTRGHTNSCGCHRLKALADALRTHGLYQDTGLRYLADTFNNLVARSTKHNNVSYLNYGGRGILCEFASLDEFSTYVLAELGPRPLGYSLDRIDNNGNYAKGNLRWASRLEQSRNRRVSRMVDLGSGPIHLAKAAEQVGLPYKLVYARVARRGWTVERALATPARPIPFQQPESPHANQPT